MDYFFKPKGVAVIGASPNPNKGGNILIANMQKGYSGHIYPVNPRYEEINGLKCYTDILDVPDPVDLAIVYVGASMVPQTIEACSKRGISGAMLQSAGFSESGGEGEALQLETAKIAKHTGIRLWGPNCMGLVDAVNKTVFSTVAPTIWSAGMTPGNVSLIVQSGMLAGAFLIDLMTHGTMGISKACSIGNKMDIHESDILEYFLDDPKTGVIGLYLESIVDGPRFISLCRRSDKPIVILKGGKSVKGAEAALSHTASMAGNDAVVSGALRQAGVIEADDFFQMTDLCRALGTSATIGDPAATATPGVKQSKNETSPVIESNVALQNRIAILTYSGGAGIVSTDFLESQTLELADLSEESLDMLQPLYPPWMPPANPMDLWPGIIGNGAVKVYNESVRVACADPGVDGIFAHCFVGGFGLEPDLSTMAQMAKDAGKPLICWISGEREAVHQFQVEAERLGVPVFREVYRAVECLGTVLKYRQSRREAQNESHAPVDTHVQPAEPAVISFPDEINALLDTHVGSLDEHQSKKILAALNIPVSTEQLTGSSSEAKNAAQSIGFPVVMKGVSSDIIHKTEADLVRLNISSSRQVETVFSELMKAMDGDGQVLVQSQIEGGLEVIVGLVRDPQFGTCVMCGLGGVFAELLQDRVFAVAPLTHDDALALVGRLKSQPLLNGFRGAEPLHRDALADILVRISQLGLSCPGISEIDINPLIISDGQPVAVDATIILNKKDNEEKHHD